MTNQPSAPSIDFQEEFKKAADVLSWSLKDPEKITEAIKEWMIKNAPERLGTAYWIITSGERDKGFSVTLLERQLPFKYLPLNLRAQLFLGRWSGGVGVATEVYRGMFRKGQTLTVHAFVGVFAPLNVSDFKAEGWSVGAGILIPFKS